MKNTFLMLAVAAVCFSTGCETTPKETSAPPVDTTTMVAEEIRISPLSDSPAFSDAILELNSPGENSKVKTTEGTSDVTFDYTIKNYKLMAKTDSGSCALNCANSDKGQHIHLILNNKPYLAKYETNFVEKLDTGHYVALSFLSRSYHESLKHFEAFDLRQFTVGSVHAKKVDLKKPLLFYSRPKGDYVGKDTKRVLLDFFLVNTELSETGNKVKAVINGKEFILTKWQAYVIEGLPLGENTIHLELVDKDGKVIEGPYNVVDRVITLKK